MSRPSLGNQESELLRYIAEQGPLTVGEVAEGYGKPRGLARSTVVTVMERLRKKGYLTRQRDAVDGVFRYASSAPSGELVGGLIQQFVQKTLGGSLTPFVAYFARSEQLSGEERAQLERIVARLEAEEAKQPESAEATDAANQPETKP